MKKINLLVAMLCISVMSAFAKGEISITTSPAKACVGETVDVIVSMTNAENEVRGLQFDFNLPTGLQAIGIPSHNEDRFDGFVPTLDIKNANEASRVTFLSFGGDYVTETEGEVFRFTVKIVDENYCNFYMKSEITYDGGNVDKLENYVRVAVASPYTMTANESSLSVGDEPATVNIALENKVAASALQFVVELPEGLEFVKTSNGKKVNWSYSSRVAASKTTSEKLDEEAKTVNYLAIDVMSSDKGLIAAGDGEIISFEVKKNGKIENGSCITIKEIKVSTVAGRQYNQDEEIVIAIASEYTPGDVNGDGKITNADLVSLCEKLLNDNDENTGLHPDVNGDGKVTNADYVELVEILLHQ